MEELLGPNRPEDVSWLCSLSESELDLLVVLKSEVMRRAKLKGCDEVAHKFDLKTLRALAFVMMTCVKDKIKNSSLAESGAYLESCNLLKSDVGDIMSLDEIRTCIGMDSRNTPFRRKPHKESTPKQKKRKRNIL